VGDEERVEFVRIVGVPVRAFLESQDHQHDLIRELQLITIGAQFDVAKVEISHRVAKLVASIHERYESVRSATREQALAARARGDLLVDLDVPIVPDMAASLRHWLELLEEADELCRDGDLLLLATQPEIRDLRRWYVETVIAALDGATPSSGGGPEPRQPR